MITWFIIAGWLFALDYIVEVVLLPSLGLYDPLHLRLDHKEE